MSQHDYNIANGGGAAVRSDINSALGAIQSLNSGTTAPATTVAGMLWYDTLTGSLKQRNSGNTAWVSAAELLSGGQLAGMRNRIMNGRMDIAQRGTSFTGIGAGGAYSLDRWFIDNNSDAAVTISQQLDVPSSNEFQNSLRSAVTTADASIAAGQNNRISQKIEGYHARDLIGKTFTISFWVRSSKTGVHCVALRNSGANRSFVSEYTISAANTWEYKTITVSGGLITAGTWDWTNGTGIALEWSLACGTTFQTTANAWQTGNFFATANQVNCLDTIGNIFAITGVQLEPGGVATPFEHRPIGLELALCQRYYEVGFLRADLYSVATGLISMMTYYKATKRATPTVTYSGTGYSNASGITTDASSDASGFESKATVTASGGAAFTTSWQSAVEL